MAGCKLTASLDSALCEYAVAGIAEAYLANWYPATTGAAAVAGKIAYQTDEDGYIDKMTLPTGEAFFKLNGSSNTMSFTDALLAGGNGGKYRQHTFNAVLNQLDLDTLGQGDAISLGKYVVVLVDTSGRTVILGRISGLSAPAGGFDYNSGAAEADATGWTVILQGGSKEIARLGESSSIITPIFVVDDEEEG